MSIADSCSVYGCKRQGKLGNSGRRTFIRGYCNSHLQAIYQGRELSSVGGPRTRRDFGVGKRSDHPLYRCWRGMCARCLPSGRYARKGITVCDEWKGGSGFRRFIDDMGDKPSPKHSIDRIDGNMGYSPDNCRWATHSEQMINRVTKGGSYPHQGIIARYTKTLGLRYTPRIYDGEKIVVLGTYGTIDEAVQSRIDWCVKNERRLVYTSKVN